MIVPLQIWSPLVVSTTFDPIFYRDLARAEREWQGEDVIILEPSSKECSRGIIPHNNLNYQACVIPAERFNVITINHLDEERKLFPQGSFLPEAWHSGLPAGLYRQWLSTEPNFIPAEKELTFVVFGQELTLSEVPDTRAMIRINPQERVNEKTTRVMVEWPPPGLDEQLLVSPEEEGKPIYAELAAKHGVDDSRLIQLEWPKPFDLLFPISGWDTLDAWHKMRDCIETWKAGREDQALQEAEQWVSRLTGEARSTLAKAWFWPKALANPTGALYEVYGKFGLEVESLEEALASETLRTELSSPVPVRRVHSWLGYFWWELYQELKTGTIGFCNHCGRIMPRSSHKRKYCAKEENSDCSRERARIRQRNSRIKS
jgi:hypothetical protein